MLSSKKNLNPGQIEKFISKIRKKLPIKGDISDIQVERLSGGYHNAVFLVIMETSTKAPTRFVVKVNQRGKLAYKMKSEFKVLKFLENEPFAPAVFYFKPKSRFLGASVVVEEYFGEKGLTDFPSLTVGQFEQLAALMAQIHSHTLKRYGPFPPRKRGTFFDSVEYGMRRSIKTFYGGYLRNLETAPQDIASLKSDVENYIRMVQEIFRNNKDALSGNEFHLIHGDFGLGNMHIKDKRIVLVDWENASACDSAEEVLYFFTHAGLVEGLRPKFLKLYAKNGGLVDSSFMKRFKAYRAPHRLGDMLWALERASEGPEGGIGTIRLLENLKIEKEFVSYGDLLKRRRNLLDKTLETFGKA